MGAAGAVLRAAQGRPGAGEEEGDGCQHGDGGAGDVHRTVVRAGAARCEAGGRTARRSVWLDRTEVPDGILGLDVFVSRHTEDAGQPVRRAGPLPRAVFHAAGRVGAARGHARGPGLRTGAGVRGPVHAQARRSARTAARERAREVRGHGRGQLPAQRRVRHAGQGADAGHDERPAAVLVHAVPVADVRGLRAGDAHAHRLEARREERMSALSSSTLTSPPQFVIATVLIEHFIG